MVNLISDVVAYLESIAPPAFQESYDNAQLITGNPADEVTGILCSLDVTEEVVQEAIDLKCNLIVAHHPIIFKGLKSLTGRDYVERTVIKAIKNNVTIYAIHTNLDNIHTGVNKRIADRLGLSNTQVLAPKKGILMKLTAFVPVDDTQQVLKGLYQAGAGSIGEYSNCSFRIEGTGTFLPSDHANPTIGQT